MMRNISINNYQSDQLLKELILDTFQKFALMYNGQSGDVSKDTF